MSKKFFDERRNFLKTLAVIGGAAFSLSAVSPKNGASKDLSAQQEEKQSSGTYQETDHIRKYYKTAGI